jgi:hypothetical protein
MLKRALLLSATLLFSLTFFAGISSANLIEGGLHFSGDLTITTDINPSSPTFGEGTITFDNVASTTHTFTIDSGSGDLSTFVGQGDESTIGAGTAPVGVPVDITDFLTFVNSPITFTLTEVLAGIDPLAGCSDNPALAASGNICTPAGTPYNLQDIAPNGTNSTASFVVLGDLVSGGDSSPAVITFTAASTGESFEQLLLDQQSGKPDTITYGAQLISLVPEPSTLRFTFAGCLLMAFGIYRRRKAH